MVRLAGELGDGAILNFTPLSAVEDIVAEAGGVEIACRFFCFPGDDLGAATRMLVGYATVPVYEAFFRAHGWGERIDPMVRAWNEGDRRRALELAPQELVREICIFGTPQQQRERLEEFVARGVQTPILTPVCPPEQVPAMIEAWMA